MDHSKVPILDSPADEVCSRNHTHEKHVKEHEEIIIELSYSNDHNFDHVEVFKCGIFYDCYNKVSNYWQNNLKLFFE